MSVRKGNDVLAGSAPIKIDSALSPTSANPVQNSIVVAALATKADATSVYTKTQVDEAFNTVNAALAEKQDIISAGDGITIANNIVAVGSLDCGTMS